MRPHSGHSWASLGGGVVGGVGAGVAWVGVEGGVGVFVGGVRGGEVERLRGRCGCEATVMTVVWASSCSTGMLEHPPLGVVEYGRAFPTLTDCPCVWVCEVGNGWVSVWCCGVDAGVSVCRVDVGDGVCVRLCNVGVVVGVRVCRVGAGVGVV